MCARPNGDSVIIRNELVYIAQRDFTLDLHILH